MAGYPAPATSTGGRSSAEHVERLERFVEGLLAVGLLSAAQRREAFAALEESDQCLNCKKDSYWCQSTGMTHVYPCPDRMERAT